MAQTPKEIAAAREAAKKAGKRVFTADFSDADAGEIRAMAERSDTVSYGALAIIALGILLLSAHK